MLGHSGGLWKIVVFTLIAGTGQVMVSTAGLAMSVDIDTIMLSCVIKSASS